MTTEIPLDVLIEARECFQITRTASAAGTPLSDYDYNRTLLAYSLFSVCVKAIAKEINVEVKA